MSLNSVQILSRDQSLIAGLVSACSGALALQNGHRTAGAVLLTGGVHTAVYSYKATEANYSRAELAGKVTIAVASNLCGAAVLNQVKSILSSRFKNLNSAIITSVLCGTLVVHLVERALKSHRASVISSLFAGIAYAAGNIESMSVSTMLGNVNGIFLTLARGGLTNAAHSGIEQYVRNYLEGKPLANGVKDEALLQGAAGAVLAIEDAIK